MALTRCLDCNATIKPDELKCYACGTRVEGRSKSKLGAGFATFLTILFVTSTLLTVGSFFLETAAFGKCLMVTIVLLVIRASAGGMAKQQE